MKPEYKNKVSDLISALETRVQLLDKMIDGTKQPNIVEAKQYIKEIENGLNLIGEFISIS